VLERVTLIGKTRARRSGNEAFRLQRALWDAGFDAQSQDHISVPEPIGVIAAFQMWFQRKVKGPTAEQLLTTKDAIPLARRVAQAIHKLHKTPIPTDKTHTIKDELKILRNCLAQVAILYPEWSQRLERLMRLCEKIGCEMQPAGPCGIHRDFYASQVIVESDRLWLIDFDLYCMGDPALDAGNFVGHITQQSLREYGRTEALMEVEHALEEEFVRLSGERTRAPLRVYRDLTLVRHIFLSTKFAERRHLAEPLLNLCEERLENF
jgi:aminoglycoside phosphotransferase (APT) family kinase protein